ncbi:hypothetical protein Clacol_007059 [Clathrus columnatus]|uniref:F-box domain-containing protein n=1 Tax=Clathrus columnatus TaxID=1419009 RepID=A0AAV5AI52_9AGAM|nr:hypothetical protein Clacol_007059 [Clathrus columnatus]
MPYPEGLPLHTIWDEIAYLIGSTKDLLSLALTCRIFKKLIIPDHLEYRHIRYDLCRTDVWMSLCDRPRLAKGIRSVKLVCMAGPFVRLPRALSGAPGGRHRAGRITCQLTDKELAMIRSSLSKMLSLKSFVWTPSYILPQVVFDILKTLTSEIQFLEELSINFMRLMSSREDTLLDNPSIWSLTNLTKVNMNYPVAAAVRMLIYCPNIEYLHLFQPFQASVLYMMQYSHWKKLRRLNLGLAGAQIIPPSRPEEEDTPAIISSFFDRHPDLESLHFTPFNIPIPKLSSTHLARLRSAGGLYCAPDPFMLTSSFLSNDIISRLVHWRIQIANVNIDSLPQMDKLESFYLPLEDSRLPDSFFTFLLKAPNLKKIYLEIDIEYYLYTRGCRGLGAWELVVDALLECSSLTHAFCEFQFPYIMNTHESLWDSSACAERSGADPRQEALYKKLSALPTLKYLRVTLSGGKKFVKLERDGDGVYSGYQFVTSKEVGGCPRYWGDFFFEL